MKLDLLTRKTLRELRRSRAQTLALVGVLALGVTTFMAAVGSYLDLDASETLTFEELQFADVWFELDPTPAQAVDEVESLPGVSAAAGRLIIDTGLPIGKDRVRARLIGTPSGRQPVNDVLVIDGTDRQQRGDVLVEQHFAEARDINPGDTITPLVNGSPLPLRVAGIVASPEYLQVTPDRYELLPAPSSFAVLFVDLAMLQEATGTAGTVNDLAVRLDDSSTPAMDRLEDDVRARSGVLDVVSRADQATYAALQQDLTAFRSIAYSIPTLILLAGILSVAVMLGRIVRNQRPLIGVMKALGYRDRTVVRHYLTYAVVIATTGSLVGLAAGTALSGVITRGYANQLGVPYTESTFHPFVGLVAVAATVLATTLAASRPAWTSSRLAPATATRVEVAVAGGGHRSLVERVVPLPLGLRIPMRTLTRARGRAISTATGIVAAFVLILMVLGLRDGINLFLHRTFDELERWDVAVTFDQPQPAEVVTAASALSGVRTASPHLQVPARIETSAGRLDVLLTALDPDQQLRALRLGDTPSDEALADDTIVLTGGAADDLGVTAGDTVTVRTPVGTHDLRVGATTDEPIPARAFISLDAAARAAGTSSPPVNGLYLGVDQAAQAQVRAALYDLPGVESVKLRSEQRSDLRSLLAIFTAVVAIMLAFAIAMAFALVFNAMTINVLEREREYATMRAVGARPAVIARLLLVEASTLWAAAIVPGVIVGTWTAQQLGEAVAAGLFVLPVEITRASYLGTTFGILAVIVLALVFPIRRIRRLDLASSTKTLG